MENVGRVAGIVEDGHPGTPIPTFGAQPVDDLFGLTSDSETRWYSVIVVAQHKQFGGIDLVRKVAQNCVEELR